MIGLEHFLLVSAALFALGIMCVLTRKNAVNVLMGVELILNSANLNLVAFSRFSAGNLNGQVFAIFVIVVAAAEAAMISPTSCVPSASVTAFRNGSFLALRRVSSIRNCSSASSESRVTTRRSVLRTTRPITMRRGGSSHTTASLSPAP